MQYFATFYAISIDGFCLDAMIIIWVSTSQLWDKKENYISVTFWKKVIKDMLKQFFITKTKALAEYLYKQ